jgi:hypothetical protein
VEGGSVYTRTVQIAPGTLPDWTPMEMAVGDGVFLCIQQRYGAYRFRTKDRW